MTTSLIVQGDTPPAPDSLTHIAALSRAGGVCPISTTSFLLPRARKTPDAVAAIAEYARSVRLDVFWRDDQKLRLENFRAFISDMDSTMITIECIDELADYHGVKAEVAAITERAMQGELNFAQSLAARVALLQGLPVSAVTAVIRERMRLSPGAEKLLGGLRAAGIYTVLVSGGFTPFTEHLQNWLGFDEAHSNTLEVVDGHLTGRVLGTIMDSQAKARQLVITTRKLHCARRQIIALGDGANDIPMLRTSGLGIAWHAKPALRTVADATLDFAPLDGILNFFA